MTLGELAARVEVGYETRSTEFKGPGLRTDRYFFAKVVWAVLGMANLSDGGMVILGVEEPGERLEPRGLSDDELASWNFDDVATGLATCADPGVAFDLERHELVGKRLVAIVARSFESVPVLCRQEYSRAVPRGRTDVVLRRGACYVRRVGRPETSEFPTSEEMRDLLDTAGEHRLAPFSDRRRAPGFRRAPGL